MTTGDRFKIRFAEAYELGRVTELIVGLHEYQEMTDCEPPEFEDIKRDLVRFNECGDQVANNKNTFVIVAVETTRSEPNNSHLVGYMIYTQSYFIRLGRHIHINSFFIDQDYRRHGLGSMFMRFLSRHAKLLGNDKLDVPYANVNHVAINFYRKMNAQCVNDQYQLYLNELTERND